MRVAARLFSVLAFVGATGMLAHERAAQPTPTVPPLSGKLGTPIQLFNGKNLADWIWYQRPAKPGETDAPPLKIEDVWSVKDGVLHSKGTPTGYIRTTTDFKNFVLTVEERHITKGNGGLLVGIKEVDRIWPGLEIQTMTGSAGDLWNHNLLKLTADAARTEREGRHVKMMGPDSQKPIGEWDTIELTIDSGNLIYKVNGRLQNLATNTEDLSGKIGLQAEGAEMEFRKVQLTPIQGK
jgi:hypothetical protein